jgi:hypothetical protein
MTVKGAAAAPSAPEPSVRIAAIGCIPGVLSTSMRAELREIKKRSLQARFS